MPNRILGLCALLLAVTGCNRTEEATATATESQPATATAVIPAQAEQPAAANVTNERLLNAANEPSQWLAYGGDYEEQRYSRLQQINTGNVKDLGLAWFADFDSNLSQNSTPLYIDGVIYASTPWSIVYAYEAKTGALLWKFNPRTPREWARKVCCGLVNRGIAAWNGKIYVGTFDAKLIAIDANTGKEVWSTYTLDQNKINLPTERYSITMAPRIARGKVIIGNSGSEFGVRGYISAYDAETGKLLWRYYTVPGNPADGFENEQMKTAAATWSGEWWKLGGGGTVWDTAIYDPVNDLVIFGTGNGTPWNQKFRDPESGDNLFLSSIMAVKLETGEYVWHYQATPAETWDYDASSPMTIANITLEGQQRRVVMQASKNGFFYMLDVASGELLRAEPFTEVNWADGVDMATGRPRTRPEARYQDASFNLLPGVQGAHGWHPNAYNPETGLIYIATQHAYSPMVADPNYQPSDVGFNLGINFGASFTYYAENPKAPRGFEGFVQAWDPVAGKQVWRSESNQGPTGSVLATAGGLIFQGSGSGQEFRAYDARTGDKLWSMQAQTAVLAGPISYELDGQQYIAVNVGGNQQGGYYAPNYSRLLVFALNSKVQLPPVQEYIPPPLDPPPATAAAEVVNAGRSVYSQFCAVCHGEEGQTRGGGVSPDLTRSPMLHSQESFDTVVLWGALTERGMGSFGEALKTEDTQAIRAFIIARANELKNAPPPAFGAPPAQQQQTQAQQQNEQVEQPHVEQ